MVLVERTSDNLRNGRRSRGPSPNGHASETTTTSGEEGDGLPEEKIRVGRDYQAAVPEIIPSTARRPNENNDRALLVWSPSMNISESSLDEYISLAKEKYGYNGEQALGMLFWHKHDLERAIRDLANFTPYPDDWTVEDRVLFEQAFQFHGKSFHRIRQMLPDKTIPLLVKYYYTWKKTRTRTSLMDRQARKLASQRDEGSEGGSEHGSNTDSDSEEKVKLEGDKIKASCPDSSNENMAKPTSIDPCSGKSRPADCTTVENSDSKTLTVNSDGKSNVELNLDNSNVRKQPQPPAVSLESAVEVKLSPNKRRLLSTSSSKPAKIRKISDSNIKPNVDEGTTQESVSKVEGEPKVDEADSKVESCSNNVSDTGNLKPIIQIATLVK